jgi:8-oxo-dGTP pyrophosphatase MutT (NUDIX family)
VSHSDLQYKDRQIFPREGEPAPSWMIRVTQREVTDATGNKVRDQIIWDNGPSITIIPVIDGEIELKEEFKYGAMEMVLTFAAGGIESGEEPEQAARRELAEEFGHANVVRVIPIGGEIVNTPDKTTERRWTFLAEVAGDPVDHEPGKKIRVPIKDARELLKDPRMKALHVRQALLEMIVQLGL